MYKIIASLYRFNMRGANKSIPYFATLTNLLALFTLCFFIIIVLLDMQSVLNLWHTGSKGGDYLTGASCCRSLIPLDVSYVPRAKDEGARGITDKERISTGTILLCFVSNNINDYPFRYCLNKDIGCLL